MTTTDPNFVVHIYKEINKGKYKTTKHYQLVETQYGECLLSDRINISKDQNFAKSSPDYWLKIRKCNKWSKNITGLFKTNTKLTYWGDQDLRKHLIVFKFSNNAETLTVFYFKNYFTNDLNTVLRQINKRYYK